MVSEPQLTVSQGDVGRMVMNLRMIFWLNTFLGKEQINNLVNNYIKTTGLKCFSGFPINNPALVQACSSPERNVGSSCRRDPLRLRLQPWGILAFLAFGKRTEALLGPGLVLCPNDLQGERAVSMFPQRVFMTLENIWGDNFWIILLQSNLVLSN